MIMKKLIFLFIAILAILSCTNHKAAKDQGEADSSVTNRILPKDSTLLKSYTLNGLPLSTADSMVMRFSKDKSSYQKIPTSVWFSKKAFQKMYSTINNSAFDGMRFYFARDASNAYTVVVVSTKDMGLLYPGTDDWRHIHQDTLQSMAPAPTQSGPEYYGVIGKNTPADGARLFETSSPCEKLDNCKPNYHYITCAEAHEMTNCEQIGPDKVNATSEWFDKGMIDTLIKFIPDNGGIRLYFGKRSKRAFDDTVARHGFVMIITKPMPSNIQRDTFMCINLNNYFNNKFINKKRHPFDGGGDDNGEQCPTNCKGIKLPQPR